MRRHMTFVFIVEEMSECMRGGWESVRVLAIFLICLFGLCYSLVLQ